jgi:hypothetical protein
MTGTDRTKLSIVQRDDGLCVEALGQRHHRGLPGEGRRYVCKDHPWAIGELTVVP